jgi:hypothetical protein
VSAWDKEVSRMLLVLASSKEIYLSKHKSPLRHNLEHLGKGK